MSRTVIEPFRWLALVVLIAAAGCKQEPSRWDQAQQQSQKKPAVTEDSVAGGEFNKFFPKVESPYDLTYKQEKTGYAEASLKHDGSEVAVLSISDTRNNPDAAEKYRDATETLSDYPLAAIGSKGSGVLVADRFQVQVRSTNEAFDESDRKQWLELFDLAGLSKLQ